MGSPPLHNLGLGIKESFVKMVSRVTYTSRRLE